MQKAKFPDPIHHSFCQWQSKLSYPIGLVSPFPPLHHHFMFIVSPIHVHIPDIAEIVLLGSKAITN